MARRRMIVSIEHKRAETWKDRAETAEAEVRKLRKQVRDQFALGASQQLATVYSVMPDDDAIRWLSGAMLHARTKPALTDKKKAQIARETTALMARLGLDGDGPTDIKELFQAQVEAQS